MHTYEIHTEGTTRYRLVLDEFYQTRGSYAYDTEEETKAAEDHEIELINNGTWHPFGIIEEKQCLHCLAWKEEDSLWGIVTGWEHPMKDALECLGVSLSA